MTIEAQLQQLTDATTDLLTQVTERKSTLDNAVIAAQGQVAMAAGHVTAAGVQAQAAGANAANAAGANATAQVALAGTASAAAQAANARDQAIAAWSAATAPAEQLAAMAQSIHYGAIVDAFLHDTSKDSDLGAWRKRTQATGWYNEPLNGKWLGQMKDERNARGDNGLTFPQELQNAAFTKGAGLTVLDNQEIAEDGTVSMALCTSTATNGTHIFRNIVATPGKPYAFTFDFKPGSGTWYSVQVYDGTLGVARIYFNAQTKQLGATKISSSGGVHIDSGIIPLKNGCYRLWIAAAQPGNSLYAQITTASGDNNNTQVSGATIYLGNWKISAVGELPSTYSASPELVANGGFDTTANLTLSGATVSGGTLNFAANSLDSAVFNGSALVAGKVYKARFVITASNAGYGVRLMVGTTLIADVYYHNVGSHEVTFTAPASGDFKMARAATGHAGSLSVDDVSVKEVTTLATPYVPYSQLAGQYYQNTTDGKFYVLNSTYGQTETFTGQDREYPAAVGVMAEANRIALYDVTKPGCPMWKVFVQTLAANSDKDFFRKDRTISSVTAANGAIYFGINSAMGVGGLLVANFVSDTCTRYSTTGLSVTGKSIAARNTAVELVATPLSIVNAVVNDIAVTVLPGAPVDPATGLPVPTVAVATAGGVSVIKDNGTVVNSAAGYPIQSVDFQGTRLLLDRSGGYYGIQAIDTVGIGTGFSGTVYSDASIPSLGNVGRVRSAGKKIATYSPVTGAFTLLHENPAAPAKGMVARISTAYNSGWQVGDSRMAALADTLAETITAPELVTNGQFVQDLTGWENVSAGAGSAAVVSGSVEITRVDVANEGGIRQALATVAGKRYTITYNRTSGTDGRVWIGTGTAGTARLDIAEAPTSGANNTVVFEAKGATTYLTFNVGSNTAVRFDNISVKEDAGVELVTNGGFDTDASGWGGSTSTVSWNSGTARMTATGPNPAAFQDIATVAGKSYTVTGQIVGLPAGKTAFLSVRPQGGGANIGQVGTSAAGNLSFTFTARAGITRIDVSGSSAYVSGDTLDFDNISVREANNLVLNGTFDVDTANWTAGGTTTLSVASGELVVTSNAAGFAEAIQNLSTVSGRRYEVTGTARQGTTTRNVHVNVQGLGIKTVATTAATPVSFQFVATAATHQLKLQIDGALAANETAIFDNIVVKDITELVTNGQFEGLLTGWAPIRSATIEAVGGRLRVTTPNVSDWAGATQGFPTVVGKTYSVKGKCALISGSAGVRLLKSDVRDAHWTIVSHPSVTSSTLTDVSFEFVATASTTFIQPTVNSSSAGQTVMEFDDISVKLVEADRSVKAKPLNIVGTLTKAPVAPGAQLVSYSGFSASNYLEQPYNADLDFGTGDFCVAWWENNPFATDQKYRFNRAEIGSTVGNLIVYTAGDYTYRIVTNNVNINTGVAQLTGINMLAFVRRDGVLYFYLNGVLVYSVANTQNLTNALAILRIGTNVAVSPTWSGVPMALLRFSATAPSADQIAQIYRDELPLFQPGAQCTIDGTSTSVTALAYDDSTDVLHVGTSWGRSEFVGLKRIASNATTSGSITAIAAGMGAHITGGANSGRYVQPSITLREELRRRADARRAMALELVDFDFDGQTGQTAFQLPIGYTARGVFVAGTKKREGATKDWSRSFDGYRETVTFGASPGATWVQLTANRSI